MAAKDTGAVKCALIDLLRAAPGGKFARELAALVDRSPNGIATRLAELQESGRVVAAHVGIRKRWFALEHADHAQQLAAVEGWKFSSGVAKRETVRTIAAALAPHSMRSGAEPMRTVAQPFVDRRFVPDRVEPFFSAMRPGNYLRTGSAIERAYGGER